MGSPQFAVPSLECLLRSPHEVVAVFTQPDRPSGRGQALSAPTVKKAAAEHGIPVLQPPRLRDSVVQLLEYKPDVIVVTAYGQILPQSILDLPPRGCINVHPSLLPRFRGASPVASAILSGDAFTGVSIMLLDAGMDTGPVLSRAAVHISDQDTTGTLTDKLALVGAGLLGETLVHWLRHELKPVPQDETKASYTRPFSHEDGEIDWNSAAGDIWRRVRAFQPWPGCYTTLKGKQLKVIEAVPLEGRVEAGRVIDMPEGEAGFAVGTGKGVLGVIRLQLEGKRAMSAAEFVRGRRDVVGMALPG
jgi:methionyl-tRNA formyltransferase